MVDLLGAVSSNIETVRKEYSWVADRVEELFGSANTGFMLKGDAIAISVRHDGLQRALVLKDGSFDINKEPNKAQILDGFLVQVTKEMFGG